MIPLLFLGAAAAQIAPATTTEPWVPPMAVGNEADKTQLALARRQGAAYAALVDWERQGAAWSGSVDAADYRLVAAISPAEGQWLNDGGAPRWVDAPAGQMHLRVFAQDGASFRFVPGLTIKAAFMGPDGAVLGQAPLPFALYPATDAYGANVVVPAGATRLAVEIEPMQMMRHDPYNGDRFFRRTVGVMPLGAIAAMSGPTASDRAESAPPADLLASRRQALEDTIKEMWSQASSGAEKQEGGMIVTYAIEYAESFWMFSPSGSFRYSIENDLSNEKNAHLEVAPRDPRTGRFIPAATVTTETVSPAGGSPKQDTPLLWHSWLYHFGKNVRVPAPGSYTLNVTVTPMPVPHYGRATGNSWWAPVSVSFADARIKTGQK